MSSDGKPLWGFRKIFFLIAVFYWVCALWMMVDLLRGAEYLQPEHQPDRSTYYVYTVLVPVCALFGVPYLWFWLEIRKQRFTQRNWIIGLILLIPSIICFPWGILPIISWSSATCRNLFHRPATLPAKPPPLG